MTAALHRNPGAAPRLVKEYRYLDPEGRLLFRKLRYEPKDFRYDRRVVGTRAYREAVYRLPELLAHKATAARLHWVEGEKDADALWDVGEFATSVHQGAGKATPEQSLWLLGAAEVWVWMDKDWYGPTPHPEVGAYDALLRVRRLVEVGYDEARIRVVCARGNGLKDAHDHLASGGAVVNARPVDPEWLRSTAGRYATRTARRIGYR